MTRARTWLATVLAAAGGLTAAALGADRPVVLWNTTASAPEGLYRVAAPEPLRVGDWLAVRPPPELASWLARRGYLPAGALLLKQVAALPPSVVCNRDGQITVDNVLRARAAAADRWRRRLPAWRGCRTLAAADVFLLNPAAGSLDGRYFGPLPRDAVVGRAIPLWLPKGDRHGRS